MLTNWNYLRFKAKVYVRFKNKNEREKITIVKSRKKQIMNIFCWYFFSVAAE